MINSLPRKVQRVKIKQSNTPKIAGFENSKKKKLTSVQITIWQWREQEIVQTRFVSKLFTTFTTFPLQGT